MMIIAGTCPKRGRLRVTVKYWWIEHNSDFRRREVQFSCTNQAEASEQDAMTLWMLQITVLAYWESDSTCRGNRIYRAAKT